MHTKTPKRSKNARIWLIISVLAVVLAEAAFTTTVVRSRGLFEYIGLDYRGSRAAGEAILAHGLGAAYDLQLLEASQRQLFNRYVIEREGHSIPFGVVPAPYLPPFSLAFVPSTLLPPVPGYLAWTLFHALLLVLYQFRLARAFGVSKPGWLIAAVVLSFPAFINLIMGQISIWLVVFFGEAVIAFDRQQRFRAGAWLGLLLFKPQVLVLFVPALALAGQWRVFLGMVASIAVVIVPILVFAGDWAADYIRGIRSAAGSTGTVMNIFPSSMTNWRACGLNAARLFPPPLAWGVALAGMIATAIAGLSCSVGLRSNDRRRPQQTPGERTGLAWLGLAAATCAFTWHSHVHQLLLLVPPLYAVVAALPRLKNSVAFSLLGSSVIFVLAAFTLGIGAAHDILGVTLLACLVAVTTACVLRLHSGESS